MPLKDANPLVQFMSSAPEDIGRRRSR